MHTWLPGVQLHMLDLHVRPAPCAHPSLHLQEWLCAAIQATWSCGGYSLVRTWRLLLAGWGSGISILSHMMGDPCHKKCANHGPGIQKPHTDQCGKPSPLVDTARDPCRPHFTLVEFGVVKLDACALPKWLSMLGAPGRVLGRDLRFLKFFGDMASAPPLF